MHERPLDGVTVVAVEQAVSMPFCSFMLAELGADIIKVERPGTGDVLRDWDNVVDGLSSGFVWVNANKRDIALNLRDRRGQEIVQRLAGTADVFVENFTPGVCDRLGLGYESLRSLNAGLIYCSLSGYGQSGPYSMMKAYDLLVQGESGILMTNGSPEEPAKVGLPITDLIAGSTAAVGIVSSLLQRQRTGEGAYLDVSMLDASLCWLGYFPHRYWHAGEEPPRTGMRHQYIHPYGPYMASDGEYVNLVVASDDHWKKFCTDVVREPTLLEDARFSTVRNRHIHRDELERRVEGLISRRPSDEWFDRLSDAGLPFGRVRGIRSLLEHPQIEHRRLIVQADSPSGQIPLGRFPLAPADAPRRIPALSEHNDMILTELGYARSEIQALYDAGVVSPRQPDR